MSMYTQEQSYIQKNEKISEKKFSIFSSLTDILLYPTRFFETLDNDGELKEPLIFLSALSLFYISINFTYFLGGSITIAVIFFFNAMLIPVITAGISWALSTAFIGKMRFKRIFTIYAYIFGSMLIFSWIPLAIVGYTTELWKAILMVLALVKYEKISVKKSLILVLLTLAVVFSITSSLIQLSNGLG